MFWGPKGEYPLFRPDFPNIKEEKERIRMKMIKKIKK